MGMIIEENNAVDPFRLSTILELHESTAYRSVTRGLEKKNIFVHEKGVVRINWVTANVKISLVRNEFLYT